MSRSASADGWNEPTKNLPPLEVRELPEPLPLGKLIGASVILLATALGSGELILWPYITTQAGGAVAGDPGLPVAVLPQLGDRTRKRAPREFFNRLAPSTHSGEQSNVRVYRSVGMGLQRRLSLCCS